jgi:hypothetical protein
MLILHDLPSEKAEGTLGGLAGQSTVFAAEPSVCACIGCFGCWIKTPGKCVIDDRGQGFAGQFAAHDESMVISRLVYGGFSPSVKAVLDRSIGYILPFFRVVNGEMHHVPRYDKPSVLRCLFYGADITAEDRKIAEKLVAANALNFGIPNFSVGFFPSIEKLAEGLRVP